MYSSISERPESLMWRWLKALYDLASTYLSMHSAFSVWGFYKPLVQTAMIISKKLKLQLSMINYSDWVKESHSFRVVRPLRPKEVLLAHFYLAKGLDSNERTLKSTPALKFLIAGQCNRTKEYYILTNSGFELENSVRNVKGCIF